MRHERSIARRTNGEDMTGGMLVFLAVYALATAGAAAVETPQTFRSEYAVTLYGLPIARSSFVSRFEGDRFHVNGSLSSAGLAKIFDDTSGTLAVSGRFAAGVPQPDKFQMDYASGKKRKSIEIVFANGSVARTRVAPSAKKRSHGWVALNAGHLHNVADPLSSVMIHADQPGQVCDRTLSVFDGEMRADLNLSHRSTATLSTAAYRGRAVVCAARFVPLAGYRKGHRSVAFLKNRSEIAIAFAPLGSTGVYAPVRASVGTEIGTIRIEAIRLESAR